MRRGDGQERSREVLRRTARPTFPGRPDGATDSLHRVGEVRLIDWENRRTNAVSKWCRACTRFKKIMFSVGGLFRLRSDANWDIHDQASDDRLSRIHRFRVILFSRGPRAF